MTVAAFLLTAGARAGEIRWRSGTVQLPAVTSTEAAADIATIAGLRGAGLQHIVVQFDAPLSEAERRMLRAAGVQLLNYVGDNAYFAAVSAHRLDALTLGQVQSLRAAVPIQRAWKLHPALLADEIVPWAIVSEPTDGEANAPTNEEPTDASETGPTHDELIVAAYLLFHSDVDLLTEGATVLYGHGAVVRSFLQTVNGAVIELPYGRINALADEDAVQYIEPPLPRFDEMNNSNRTRTGADIAQAPPYGLDGTGVSVLVYDAGAVLTTHADFGGRAFLGDTVALSDHSTHVAGTIGGDGTASAGAYAGMAPGVEIWSYGFETGGPLEAGFLYTDPGDIESDYDEAINVHGADIANNSIGTNTAPNGFPCEWTGDYGVTSTVIDSIVAGSLGAPFRIVWANGNERQTSRCGSTYATTAPPACAKNHITVGALNSNNDSVTSFTSWGPVDDGRIKPDISAPGCQSNDDGGVTSCSSSGGYAVKCGTSMASPTVTGLGALLLEDFRQQYPGEPDFRNSTLKALLAHTATDIVNPGPDYQTGYGSVRVVDAIEQLRAGNFLEATVDQGETMQLLVVAGPSDPQIKVTIAWDDPPGTPNVSPALVNDLDLEVFSPSLVQYYPWTLDPLNPAADAIRTQADHLNNIEQVVIDNPTAGAYLIDVVGFSVPQGPQTFSIVASPMLINCSTMGRIELDRPRYQCASTAEISVIDCDLNSNGSVVETVVINIASTTEAGGETVTLTETGPETALFTGTIDIAAVDSNGVLQVVEGDTITATYIDADDGFGGTNVVVTADAVVDCTNPLISNVAAVDIDPRSARVTFNTDEPASATLRYGLDCAALTNEITAPGFNTAHSIALKQLTDNTVYYYELEAEDEAGNVTIDTNGGICYSFMTPEIPDYFTELFPTFDLANSVISFAPNGSIDFYSACRYDTQVLPTDPAGGIPLALSDTGTQTVQLTGGHQILLYGTSYSTLYVNANGNITFDGADSDSTETIEDHFSSPRISALFDDLDPSEGGQITYKELSDRVVVTWFDVPEDAQNNDNTFQIEMYYDGRIQLAWLDVAALDGLVGLSKGLGVPIDYLPSDLSEFGDCGPRAPSAAGRTVVLGQNREATVDLLASDDGLPAPPGALTYIITSLPTYELRDAGDDHLITLGDLPYALADNGNRLHYTPANGFIGLDSFDFKANDGGTPPDAGDSNVATVILQVDPVLMPPLFDDFPATTYDSGKWGIIENATIDDVGIAEPSPPYSARLNGAPSGGDTLTTHLMDLTGVPDVRISYSYERTGGGESPDAGDNLYVEFLDSNGTWQLIHQYAGDGTDMTQFQFAEALLPASAIHDSFRLRFRTKGSSGTSAIDDWFVDDVAIRIGDAPYALSSYTSVRQNEFADITLEASDPNLDVLDIIILSLPQHGTLTDLGGGVIDSNGLPYTLLDNGDAVRYTPDTGYAGADNFTFKANDGTYDSNAAGAALFVEPVLAIPFEDEFPLIAFDAGKWAVTDGANIDNVGMGEPSEPYSARFNGSPTGGDVLTTYAIDLEGQADIRLNYYWERTGGGESPDAGDDFFVEYLNSNGVWQTIIQYFGDGPDMVAYELAEFTLPPNALHRDFRLRFRNTASVGNNDDWFIDDVRIFSVDAPTAFDQSLGLHKFGEADITLVGTDPTGDPLAYVVLSLPSEGELRDLGNDYLITSGDLPYTIANGAGNVRYSSTLGYVGNVNFNFLVNDGVFDSNIANVAIQVGGVLPIYSFTMDIDPGWTAEGLWEFGVPQGTQGQCFDPTSGHTGDFVYGYNLSGCYESNLPPTSLTTTSLDMSRVANAKLRFYRWLGVEDSTFDGASIEASSDHTTWSTVWEHTGGNVNETAWTLQTYDISAVADGQPNVWIRWVMGPSDGSAEYSGWNIDDVSIIGDFLADPGDIDKDGDIDLTDHRAFVACLFGPGATPAPPAPMQASDCLDAFDLDLDGDVDLRDFALFALVFD